MTSLRDKMMADLDEKVKRFGRAVMSVFATEGSADPTNDTFSYTIGNAPRVPELFVIGMAGDEASWLLNIVSERLIEGAPMGALSLGGKFGVHLLPIEDPAAKKLTTAATAWHGTREAYALVQVVVPDKNGSFPWHADCEPPYSLIKVFQKLLH